MKQTVNNPLEGYTVSKTTALFIEALKAWHNAQNAYLTALWELYGEDSGESIFYRDKEIYDKMEALIFDGLGVAVSDCETYGKENKI